VPEPLVIETPFVFERTTAEAMRNTFADGGLWFLIWSSKNTGMPPLDGAEALHRILDNFVTAEPFRSAAGMPSGFYRWG